MGAHEFWSPKKMVPNMVEKLLLFLDLGVLFGLSMQSAFILGAFQGLMQPPVFVSIAASLRR